MCLNDKEMLVLNEGLRHC